MFVEDDLVFYDIQLNNKTDLFDFMADQLEKKRYVTKEFRGAIKSREEEYPTGLELEGINVAITHTEKKYVDSQKLVVIKPKNPITFKNIENLKPIDVNLIFGLILDSDDGHLKILKRISQMFQDKEVIKKVRQIKDKEELTTYMKYYFNDVE